MFRCLLFKQSKDFQDKCNSFNHTLYFSFLELRHFFSSWEKKLVTSSSQCRLHSDWDRNMLGSREIKVETSEIFHSSVYFLYLCKEWCVTSMTSKKAPLLLLGIEINWISLYSLLTCHIITETYTVTLSKRWIWVKNYTRRKSSLDHCRAS